ncbi:PTS sugar transporter subunit IIB [Desulfovibrio mangrovi]|uniref:PTS sugar transporter subunit IIB n=1 Tax=Desulfovibrio mangrovi TaxID=2976983 RepID=UPI00224576CA|nr:PTS sugar transporter subunit IIB [Desulfovibrio mangrovi]UZP68257.1 PTS sugar transporter subunit IIB [Desulfovibrio mangrovi]
MQWVRIDNRLIHGQVIETWLPYTRAKRLLVVNDEMAADDLQQQIASLAVPGRIKADFIHVHSLKDYATKHAGEMQDTLVLVANCGDARRILENGFSFSVLNIGNLHYSPGKKQLCAHVAVTEEDEACLRFFCKRSVELDFRCVPNEPVQVKGW